MARNKIVISGYYGFDNLGDEAILEELLHELKDFAAADDIIVLSNNPQETIKKFAVASISRWKPMELAGLLLKTRLFISGGGGLFQDTQSAGSVIYYGGQLLLARLLGASTMVYAQGLGPLRREISKQLTSAVFRTVNTISVRDEKSRKQLADWHIAGTLTADPVWALEAGSLNGTLIDQIIEKRGNGELVGLSLRSGTAFGEEHALRLASVLHEKLSPRTIIVPLPLQPAQDQALLDVFTGRWTALGGQVLKLDLSSLTLPGQWLKLLGSLDCLIGMRLHSLIMALANGRPTLGLAYDPKVEAVLKEFNQPSLPFGEDAAKDQEGWPEIIQNFGDARAKLAENAAVAAAAARREACKNRELIARILGN